MTEEEISATGLFSTLDMTDFASSYQSLSGGPSSISAAAGASAPSAENSTVSSVSAGTTVSAASGTSAAAATTTSSAVSSAATAAAAVSRARGTQSSSSAQDIQSAVDKANDNLANSNRQMSFRVDAATGLTIATITNSQTGAVLQQIPGADIVALARMLADWSPGKHMLLDLIA
jgi:uncharacterized FlaG/YvyC family protein